MTTHDHTTGHGCSHHGTSGSGNGSCGHHHEGEHHEAGHHGCSHNPANHHGHQHDSNNTSADPPLKGVRNVIAVASGKGGVGKSTFAVNLAIALSQTGAKVGLLDADFYGPSIPTMFGLTAEKPETDGKNIIPLEKYGVKLMSIGFLIDHETPVIWRGPLVSSAVRQFVSEVNWDELDYLIFDLPPGTGDIQITTAQNVPLTGAVIVTTPQDVAIADVAKALTMFRKVGVPILGLVENMSYYELPDGSRDHIFGQNGGEKFAKAQGIDFLGAIPIDRTVREGGDAGTPCMLANPDAPSSRAIRQAALEVAKRAERQQA